MARSKSKSKSLGGAAKTPTKKGNAGASKKSRTPAAKGVKGYRRQDFSYEEDEVYGEVDKFADQQDTVNLNVEDDSDPSDSSDADDVNPDAVLGLEYEGQGDSDESDSEDDDSDDENIGQKMMMEDYEDAEQRKRERAIAQEESMSKNWGKNKNLYYNADTRDYEIESDDEIANLEEQEALRLQKERNEELDDDDFEDVSISSFKKKKK